MLEQMEEMQEERKKRVQGRDPERERECVEGRDHARAGGGDARKEERERERIMHQNDVK